MLRFLIILSLAAYVLFKIGQFFFRLGAQSPRPQPPRPAPRTKLKGGDYVEYEEVK